jgi:hypothetical protein
MAVALIAIWRVSELSGAIAESGRTALRGESSFVRSERHFAYEISGLIPMRNGRHRGRRALWLVLQRNSALRQIALKNYAK